MNSSKIQHQHYSRNIIGVSSVEFMWGLGIPVVIESTFLQLYLKSLGASSFAIGLPPTFLSIGISVFALFSGYLTGHLKYKRKAVIVFHIIPACAILLFGIVSFFAADSPHILTVFFASYAAFSIFLGLNIPVWQNYLMKIFPENRAVSALSVMMIMQSLAKLFSSFIIVRIVNKYAFSINVSAGIFIIVGCVFIAGSFFFLVTREPADNPVAGRKVSLFYHLYHSGLRALKNRDYLIYLVSDIEFFAVIGVISFYAVYSVEYCGISPAAAAGLFVAANYAGGIVANILLGWVGFLNLKNKSVISKLFSLSAILLLILVSSLWSFLVVSMLLGASRAIRMLVYLPIIKKMSGNQDATDYYSIAPVLTLPIAAGIPLLIGKYLDSFQHLGADSYRIVFAAMGVLIIVSLLFILKLNIPENNENGKIL